MVDKREFNQWRFSVKRRGLFAFLSRDFAPVRGSKIFQPETSFRPKLRWPHLQRLTRVLPPLLWTVRSTIQHSMIQAMYKMVFLTVQCDVTVKFYSQQIKIIFTRKVQHLASFWKWEFLELGNGLFQWHFHTYPDCAVVNGRFGGFGEGSFVCKVEGSYDTRKPCTLITIILAAHNGLGDNRPIHFSCVCCNRWALNRC